jgi:ComF family protein
MLHPFLDILFPSRCAGCGATVGSHHHNLCPACAGRINVLTGSCPVCSGPRTGSTCVICAERHWYIDKNITISDYSGVMKSVICKMKFGRIRSLHAVLGDLALRELARSSVSADIITWVPMNPAKQWDRGFNQSELISQFISKKTGIPCRTLLREKKCARAQRTLGLQDRFINSLGRYEATRRSSLSGLGILIIDDVHTTGATINECARQLRLAGASRIFSLTIARTDIKRLEKF